MGTGAAGLRRTDLLKACGTVVTTRTPRPAARPIPRVPPPPSAHRLGPERTSPVPSAPTRPSHWAAGTPTGTPVDLRSRPSRRRHRRGVPFAGWPPAAPHPSDHHRQGRPRRGTPGLNLHIPSVGVGRQGIGGAAAGGNRVLGAGHPAAGAHGERPPRVLKHRRVRVQLAAAQRPPRTGRVRPMHPRAVVGQERPPRHVVIHHHHRKATPRHAGRGAAEGRVHLTATPAHTSS